MCKKNSTPCHNTEGGYVTQNGGGTHFAERLLLLRCCGTKAEPPGVCSARRLGVPWPSLAGDCDVILGRQVTVTSSVEWDRDELLP